MIIKDCLRDRRRKWLVDIFKEPLRCVFQWKGTACELENALKQNLGASKKTFYMYMYGSP